MTELLGFIAQCGICPQRAVVATQPEQGWVCPRCAEVAGGASTDGVVDAYISCGAEHPIVHNHHCALPEGHESVVNATEVFTWPRQPTDPGFGDVDVAQAEHVTAAPYGIDLPAGMTLQQYIDAHKPPDTFVRLHTNVSDDDDYPLGSVQG